MSSVDEQPKYSNAKLAASVSLLTYLPYDKTACIYLLIACMQTLYRAVELPDTRLANICPALFAGRIVRALAECREPKIAFDLVPPVVNAGGMDYLIVQLGEVRFKYTGVWEYLTARERELGMRHKVELPGEATPLEPLYVYEAARSLVTKREPKLWTRYVSQEKRLKRYNAEGLIFLGPYGLQANQEALARKTWLKDYLAEETPSEQVATENVSSMEENATTPVTADSALSVEPVSVAEPMVATEAGTISQEALPGLPVDPPVTSATESLLVAAPTSTPTATTVV